MKKAFWITNFVTVALMIAGCAFDNTFGMVVIGLALLCGAVNAVLYYVYFSKRVVEDVSEEMDKLLQPKHKRP